MHDQADDLRRLATRGERKLPVRCGGRPTVVVVAGGANGVGTTTVAASVAFAAAGVRRRVLLLDSDAYGETAGRGLEQLSCPGLPAELVVIDAGARLTGSMAPHVARIADAVLLVTSGDTASVIGTFAAIKTFVPASPRGSRLPTFHVIVNRAPNISLARTVHYRLAQTCRRMLGIDLHSAGHIAASRSNAKAVIAATIGLTFQAALADTIRGASAASGLLN
jgi:MinD-like ATPase involved in chromosome partitioning or flagellar assembly